MQKLYYIALLALSSSCILAKKLEEEVPANPPAAEITLNMSALAARAAAPSTVAVASFPNPMVRQGLGTPPVRRPLASTGRRHAMLASVEQAAEIRAAALAAQQNQGN